MARPTYDPYFGKDTYNCKRCGDKWKFVPEDYENPWEYPVVCPLCLMPLRQMIRDVYEEEGVRGVIRQIYKKYFPPLPIREVK